MMLPEMEAAHSSLRNGLLHCMHCIGSPQVPDNVTLVQEIDDADSQDHHAPAGIDGCLLVRLKPSHDNKLAVADFHLHDDEYSYDERDASKRHDAEQYQVRQCHGFDSSGPDPFLAQCSMRSKDIAD
jgi:hypothetical protein